MIALSRRRLFALGGAGAVASFTIIPPWLSAAVERPTCLNEAGRP